MQEIKVMTTQTINFFQTPATSDMPIGTNVLAWLHIPITTESIILLYFGIWGVWHWILMGRDAVGAVPRIAGWIRGYDPLKGDTEDDEP